MFFIRLNTSKYKHQPSPLTDEQRHKLFGPKRNRGDWLLYQHFNKTFWKKVSKEKLFYKEVKRIIND